LTRECQRTGLSGGVKPRSYQVTLALLGTAAGDRSHAGQADKADTEPKGQPAADSEPNRHIGHEPVRENQDDTERSL